MKGITFTGDRRLEVQNFADPTPGPRDVVLEIKASGMCGTDLGAYRSPTGRVAVGATKVEGAVIAGHEPCGVVVAVGSAVSEREARVGDRVVDHHYDGCGACRHCSSGWTQLCLKDAVAYGYGGHGAHAKYMRVAAHSLVPLPEEISFPAGAAIACGTGTAYGALKRIGLEGDETIAIFGQGPVGLSATVMAVEMGARDGVDHVGVAHFGAVAQIHGVWRLAHAFLAAGNNDGAVARTDGLGCKPNGFQARAADVVDGVGRHHVRQTRPNRGLARRVLALASRQHMAEDDLRHILRRDASAGEGLFDGDGAQLYR